MDREQLFQNLNELEKQLTGIKSATEQVNAVTAANRAVIDSVKEYTAQTQKMLDSIRDVYDGDVKVIKEAAEKALKQSSDNFEMKVNSIAKDLVTGTANLNSMVEDKLTPLVKNDLVGIIDKVMKPFVLDEMPSSFKNLISDYYSFLEDEKNNITAVVNNFLVSSEAALKELRTSTQVITDSQSKISETFSGFEGKLGDISHSQTETNRIMVGLNDSIMDVAGKMKESAEIVERTVSSLNASFDHIMKQLSSLSESTELSFDEFKSSVNTEIANAAKETNTAINNTSTKLSQDITTVINSVKPVKQIDIWTKKADSEIEDIKKLVEKNRRLNIFNMILLYIVLLLLIFVLIK